MKKRLLAVLLGSVLLCGCGSSGAKKPEENYEEYEPAGAASMEYAAEGDYAPEEEKAAGTVNREEADPAQFQEKLVYRGRLTIESVTYDDTLKNIRELIRNCSGIIENESESDEGNNWYSEDYRSCRNLSLTVRIPTEKYEQFLQDMEGTGKITSRYSEVENITRMYNDTTVRIEALKQQQERLLDMMAKADTVEDMILVETRLTEVQTDLNLLQSDMNRMDTDIKYSTVTISLKEVYEYTADNPTFGEKLSDAFAEGWDGFVWFTEGIIILVISLWPVILIAAAVIFVIRVVLHGRKKNREKAEEPKEIV